MAIPLIPILGSLVAQAVPAVLDLINGDDDAAAKRAVTAVSDVARQVAGVDDDEAAANAIQADPALFNDFQRILSERAIGLYRAETERLQAEQGAVDADTLAALPPAAAAKVALLRMTTRPRVVLRLSHVILLPIYVIAIDGALALANILSRAFGAGVEFEMLGATFFTAGSLYLELYTWAAPTAASVILGYMGLREVGKATGSGDHPLAKVAGLAGGLLRRVKG